MYDVIDVFLFKKHVFFKLIVSSLNKKLKSIKINIHKNMYLFNQNYFFLFIYFFIILMNIYENHCFLNKKSLLSKNQGLIKKIMTQ